MNAAERLLLFLEKADIPSWVEDELRRYNDTAGRNINTGIFPYVQPFLPKKPLTMYRGLGFSRMDGLAILKKLKLKAEVGATGAYKTGKYQSWTTSKTIAEEFMQTNTLAGKQKDSLGILLKATVEPSQVAVPYALLPKDVMKGIRFHQDEFILHPGTYQVEVIKLAGEWPEAGGEDSKKLYTAVAKAVAAELKGKLTKNWNKTAGFGIDLLTLAKDKFVPSVQVFFDDDLSVQVEPFGERDKKPKEYTFKSVEELNKYISNKLANDIISVAKSMGHK